MGRNRARPRNKRSRARMAMVACVLWLASFEVLPWLHVAMHDHVGKHHHDASGAIVRDDEDDDDDHVHDEHDVGEHDHHTDDEDAEVDEHGTPLHARHHHKKQRDPEKRFRDALTHGRHSLAHHDVATISPAPVITVPLPVDRRPTFVLADTAIEPYSFSPGRAVARGPPRTPFES